MIDRIVEAALRARGSCARRRSRCGRSAMIKREFARVLGGMYHARIEYPTAVGGVTSSPRRYESYRACSNRTECVFAVARERVASLARAACCAPNACATRSVSVAFVTDRRIAALNREHLGHRGPTDVISFGFAPVGTTRATSSATSTSRPTSRGRTRSAHGRRRARGAAAARRARRPARPRLRPSRGRRALSLAACGSGRSSCCAALGAA